jgi:hypothetical protein
MTDLQHNAKARVMQAGSVCPFSAACTRICVKSGDRQALLQAAGRFAATRGKVPNGALLVLSDTPVGGFEATRAWAREVFLELTVCFGMLVGVGEEELAKHVDAHVRPILMDDGDPRRVTLQCSGDPVFAICLAPVYPLSHPRYAPEPTVVVTWHADVAAVQDHPAVARIREVMKREHGSVYDANELMLPLPEAQRREPVLVVGNATQSLARHIAQQTVNVQNRAMIVIDKTEPDLPTIGGRNRKERRAQAAQQRRR